MCIMPAPSFVPLAHEQHFHYSYVLNAAAVLAYLRPSWATAENKDWVDTLIRDVNDPNKVMKASQAPKTG